MENIFNKFFYARVSTRQQELGRQLEQAAQWLFCKSLNELDPEETSLFETQVVQEKVSGKNTKDRPLFTELLNAKLRAGDTLAVSEMSRLGRNYDEIRTILADLQRRNIGIEILDFEKLTLGANASSQEKLIHNVLLEFLGYISESERITMLERQKQGIAYAKENHPNKYRGRKIKYAPTSEGQDLIIYNNIMDGLNKGVSKRIIAKENEISRGTVYNIISRLGGKDDEKE